MGTNSSNSLRFVRKKRRLSVAQIAAELKVSVERMRKYESGEAVPTIKQYQALQDIYGVPDYQLALGGQPELRSPVVDLRKSVATPLRISPKGWKAYFSKAQLAELIDGIAQSMQINPEMQRPGGITKKNISLKYEEIANLIDFQACDRRWVDEPALALRYLRAKIEKFGVYCFFVEAPAEDFRGLYDKLSDRTSLILVNKKTFKDKARIFTLAHEFAHYLVDVEGASDPGHVDLEVELACNRFASRLLAPPDCVERLVAKAGKAASPDKIVRYVSAGTLLSQGGAAFRLKEDGVISEPAYKAWFRSHGLSPGYSGELTREESSDAESSGGSYAYTVVTDLGFRSIQIVQRALRQGVLDDVAVGHVLNARGSTQDKVFQTVKARLEGLGL